jgi:hypothetical protein
MLFNFSRISFQKLDNFFSLASWPFHEPAVTWVANCSGAWISGDQIGNSHNPVTKLA